MIKEPKVDSTDTQINKSLRFSFLDGVFASAMAGFIQDYLTPFLLLLGATTRHVGMLNAFPNLCASLVQLKSPDLVEKIKSRRKITNIFVFLQALMLLPMVFVAFLQGTKPSVFILFVVFYAAFGAVALPGWGSMMSDLVAKNKWGEYFGWRNRVLGFIIVATTFVAGFLLYQIKKFNIFYGFGILFSFAFIFRIFSWYFLTRMHDPPLEHKKEDCFSLFDFLARIKES
ncbi:MAG: MFS transporter, partial [Candidatus Omnitrophica bacterium]|nr:MFS transporter [Candidatus Omnitrophota bacterium]